MTDDKYMDELGQAARRASSIVTEHIDSIIAEAEHRAERIRGDAERDAELTKREALDSASRVFERIQTLERPLGELVETLRFEMDRVCRELDGEVGSRGGPAIDSTATDAPPALGDATEATAPPEAEVEAEAQSPPDPDVAPPEASPPAETAEPAPGTPVLIPKTPEPSPPRDAAPPEKPEPEPELPPETHEPEPQPETHEPEPQPETQEPEPQPAAVDPASPAEFGPPAAPTWHERAVTAPSGGSGKLKRALLSRFRDGGGDKGVFITSQGHCSVCQKTFMAGSREALDLSGWRVNGDVGLCPECQSNGWQLPEAATLPYRRGGG